MSQTNNETAGSRILTAEEEEKLLQPILDHIGSIQERLMRFALREPAEFCIFKTISSSSRRTGTT